ncbi:hypothetical protein GTN66_05050 [bacterium]|nr:hypothetical protein [bacterium]NIN92709.1 hypothetical protein [bacterium]NIO18690.1 hypothetical protein [bacterium]NIO73766.1 hypothetical protein [bacterium]
MRLWSLHPKYLDTRGLIALWREALLAQKVIAGRVKAFKNHPQLERFRNSAAPEKAIENYLMGVWEEAKGRGYNFDRSKIGRVYAMNRIPVARAQLKYEFDLLCTRLKTRDSIKYQELSTVRKIKCHPIFRLVEGGIEEWEKVKRKIT